MVGTLNTDWPVVHAITRTVKPEKHSQRCPCWTHRMAIERCTCWVLHDARQIALRIAPIYEARMRRE